MSGVGETGGEPTRVGRYEIRRRLGTGGMGVVYEAVDTESGAPVAMKVMRKIEATSLYRFKKEFRVLADLRHPNLVRLHELVSKADRWFFTMELVEGENFRDYVRPSEGGRSPVEHSLSPTHSLAKGTEETKETVTSDPAHAAKPQSGTVKRRRTPFPLDEKRLRAALAQLASGVAFLHRSGCLHRDIKPSNVLVTAKGRVVLCDFGLVKELSPDWHSKTAEQGFAGTVNYMSPEQATGAELTEASDWYSVGVMLYEGLTGELPYYGDRATLLDRKRADPPPSPRESNPEAPEDLCDLCLDLLELGPADRPSGREVLSRLGHTDAARIASARAPTARPTAFVGRVAELTTLREALAAARRGSAITVFLHGSSGMGKTSILHRFIEEVRDQARAAVMLGRCYERESVPYKGFDNIVDRLTTHLTKLPRAEVDALVPPDVAALSRLFPVLRRVASIDDASLVDFELPDAQESRQRAIAALRELLRRVSARQPLVLCIDDLQWGDLDSGQLLGQLLRPPGEPKLLLVLSYRSDEAESSPLLKALQAHRQSGALGDVREIAVDTLPLDEARELASSLLGSEEHSDTIARESGGNPFLVNELAEYLLAGAELIHPIAGEGGEVRLHDVLAFRIEQVSPAARKLLSVIAVAGHPLARGVAARAAEIVAEELDAADELRGRRLVRTSGVREDDTLETYHDRIREAVLSRLDADSLRATHERIARAYEERGGADPEIMVEHWRGAGSRLQASSHAAIAASQAAQAYAFDRAARLYRLALELGEQPTQRKQELRTALGDALANAGRGAEAAEAYVAAAEGANTADALELKRRAAEQWLHTGHFDRGLEAIREVLDSVGLRLAATPKRALLSLLSRRVWLKLRGLGYQRRDPSQVSPEVLTRLDILRSVATGLSLVDVIRAADFNTRYLLRALRVGEPHRVARALAVEAAHSSGGGGKTRTRTDRLREASMQLAKELDDPHAIGLSCLCSGLAAFLTGRWQEARDLCAKAEQVFRDRTAATTWELVSSQTFMLGAMFYLGDLIDLARLVPARLREAEERGNVYFATGIRSWRTNTAWLALDDPEEARAQVETAHRQWTRTGFHLQHYYEMLANSQIDLYTGKGESGLAHIEERWAGLKRSLLLRIQNVRVESHHVRARCAVATAERTKDASLVARARADARRIAAEKMPWAAALSKLVDASAATLGEQPEQAVGLLQAAEAELRACDMRLYAAAAQFRRGRLVGGDEGSELVASAERNASEMGAASPHRMFDMLAPGFERG